MHLYIDAMTKVGVAEINPGTSFTCFTESPGKYKLVAGAQMRGEAELVLSDIPGKIIFRRIIFIDGTGTDEIPIDLSAYGKGLYLVNVRGETFNHTIKLLNPE